MNKEVNQRRQLDHLRRIVVKVGTAVISGETEIFDRKAILNVTQDVCELLKKGIQVILVSSGAIRAGVRGLEMDERPVDIPSKQALAAVGQSTLMTIYSEAFTWGKVHVGQLLLTAGDFLDPTRYLNARNTIARLLELGVVPIVNENDSVATEELGIGDNDNLSALVASKLDADLLILLSDVDGLYRRDPRGGEDAEGPIPYVGTITREIEQMASDTGDRFGTGGMVTKIEAARTATSAGVAVVIAPGRQGNVIPAVVRGEPVGTWFAPSTQTGQVSTRKRRLAWGRRARGWLIVDDGARQALAHQGRSLLSSGVVAVEGDFKRGELVHIGTQDRVELGRGLTNYSAEEIRKIRGKHSSEIAGLLGHKDYDEVVHRDNMVVLKMKG